jgi:hypothetical protein
LILLCFFPAATSPRQAKRAFVFASIEQLVPVLSDKCIRDWVWGVCYPWVLFPPFWYTAVILLPALTLPFNSCFSAHNCSPFFFFKRHLSDSSHRETYESAHSVILSIFAFHAQRQQHTGNTKTTNAGEGDNKHSSEDGRVFTPPISNPLREEAEEESAVDLANFVERMVPFYAQCLIEVGVFFLRI